jgi:hypothetical protein
MIIIFFIIAVVVSLPVAAIVLVSVASRREDHRYSLGGPAEGRVEQTARQIVDFRTETRYDWSPAIGVRPSAISSETEPVSLDRPRRRIDAPLQATRMVTFRQAA